MRRRSVVLSALSGALTGALTIGRSTVAQAATPDAMAHHPIVGVWNVMTPGGPSLAVFFANGANIQGLPATQMGPQGVTFVGPQVGTWEPTGPRSIHFTGVQLHSDANGDFTGTVTIDAYPEVSEDGQTLHDDLSQGMVTIRNASGVILEEMPSAGGPPVTGIRMGVGLPGFPAGMSGTATPTT
jgi:hypothetical protein